MTLDSFFFFWGLGGGEVDEKQLQLLIHYVSQDGLGFAAGTKDSKISEAITQHKFIPHSIHWVSGELSSAWPFRDPGKQRLCLNTCFQGALTGEEEVVNCSGGLINSVGNHICLYVYISLSNTKEHSHT